MKICRKNLLKCRNGITLIALVVTIIVLLILAGISISMLSGDNGILQKATDAKTNTDNAQIKERAQLAYTAAIADGNGNLTETNLRTELSNEFGDDYDLSEDTATNEWVISVNEIERLRVDKGTSTPQEPGENDLPIITVGETAPSDSNATYSDGTHTAVIPAGFTVSSTNNNIETGLVINDSSGNEFVWIPVGISKNETSITLERYSFDENGVPNLFVGPFVEEDLEHLTGYGNTEAKNINSFKESVSENGGYYIGRYEAKTTTERTSSSDLTQITVKPNDYIYNYISQTQAAQLSKNMYTSEYFESDLMNSYAWDTAILFLQTFDNRTSDYKSNSNYKGKYSNQVRLSASFANTGTNNLTTISNVDKICNIYDMSANYFEWTTETFSQTSQFPAVYRGDANGISSGVGTYVTQSRSMSGTVASESVSFRPILYLK